MISVVPTRHPTAMSDPTLQTLLRLAAEIDLPQTLEELLQRVADRTAAMCDAPTASVRLLDPTRTRLLVGFRSGRPLHRNAGLEFALGQGLIGWIAQHGRPLRTGQAQQEARYLPRDDLTQPFSSFLGVPLSYGRACIGVLSTAHPDADHFTAEHEQALTLVGALCSPHLEVARLARLARVDPLTGTLNQRGLDETLPQSVASSDLVQVLSLAMVDVDGFRALNDQYGHVAGDAVLRTVGETLAGSLRVGDSVVRYGGDEFLLVLPAVALGSASRVAERVRRVVGEARVPAGVAPLSVTVSVGLAQRLRGEPREALIARAGTALAAARGQGGNCVRLAAET
jgi:diguanylate cyclase (GGDEF)-like protein